MKWLGTIRNSKRNLTLKQFAKAWPILAIAGPLLLLYGLAGWLVFGKGSRKPVKGDVSATALPAGEEVRLPVTELDPGRMLLFSYPVRDQVRIRFLVQKDNDGTIRAALATCPVCYSSSRLHYAMLGIMICGKCNHLMRVPSPAETTPQNNCTLVRLPYSTEESYIVFKAQALAEIGGALEPK